jgi:predicted nucleic acid-binding protein
LSAAGYIVDASVALKWFLREEAEPDADLARQLIGNAQLRTTSLCPFEIGNTLTRFFGDECERIVDALDVVSEICGDPIDLIPVDYGLCASLATRHGLTFYDASYVAIAERLGRKVISADRDLLGPGLAVDIRTALESA